MATEAQLHANRQNAQRSTGPKTEAGKAASRQNSLKHGLTGQAIVQPEGSEADLLQLRIQSWTNHLRPQTPTEEWLITSAAVASARIDRCIRYETATLDHRLRHLPATRKNQKAEALEALLEVLKEDPEKAHPALLDSATGTRYLLESWLSLRESLNNGKQSPGFLLNRIARLIGRRRSSFGKGRDLHDLARIVLACYPETSLIPPLITEFFDVTLPADTPAESLRAALNLPPREAAEAAFLTFIETQIDCLETHLEPLEALEAQDDAEAADLALFDPSPEAARLHRYEAALFRQLNQCLTRLERLRSNQETTPAYQSSTEPRKTWQELHKPEPEPRPQHHTPIRKNEPNFPPANPDRTHGNFINFTVGTPKNHTNHPPKKPHHPRA